MEREWQFLEDRTAGAVRRMYTAARVPWDTAPMWIRVAVSPRELQQLKKLQESILLLGRMGTSSLTNETWMNHMTRHSYQAVRVPEQLLTITPRFDFVFDEKIDDWSALVDSLFRYDGFSAQFQEDLTRMAKLYIRHDHEMTKSCVIPFRLSFSAPTGLETTKQAEFIESIVHIVRHLQQVEPPTDPIVPTLKFESIEVLLSVFSPVTEVVTQLDKLLQTGVKLRKLELPSILARSIKDQPALWRTAWASAVLTACGHPNAKLQLKHKIDELAVRFDADAPTGLYDGLFTALTEARCVSKVSVNMGYSADVKHWKWVVYGLFSRDVTSSVESVEVALVSYPSVDPERRKEAETLLSAICPRTLLSVEGPGDSKCNLGYLKLAVGTRVEISEGHGIYYTVTDPNGQSFGIIQNDMDSHVAKIVVPGYGCGSVDRSLCPVKKRRTTCDVHQPQPADVSPCQLTSVVLRDNNLEAVLPYISSALQSIDIRGSDSGEVTLFHQIFAQCPKLRDVKLPARTSLSSLEPLTNACRGGLRLRSLIMTDCSVDDAASMVDLMNMLAEPDVSLWKSLEVLVLGECSYLTDDFARALAHVVCVNPRLRYLLVSLDADLFEIYDVELSRTISQLKEIDSFYEMDKFASNPLRIESKVAFLSVFASARDNQAKLPYLDRGLASLIFDFAGNLLYRCLNVERLEDPEASDEDEGIDDYEYADIYGVDIDHSDYDSDYGGYCFSPDYSMFENDYY